MGYNLGIPEGWWNTPRGLTRSYDSTREGLAMDATRTLPTRRQVAADPHPELAEAVTVSRFWRMVDTSDPNGCWPWLGLADRDGYGIFTYRGKRRPAHEMALSFSTGELRHAKFDTCHSCDNPACCNPSHLRFGTRASNVAEMYARGRENNPSKLTAEAVVLMRERRALGARQQDLAEDFGITAGLVSQIVRGLRWANAGGPIQTERKYCRG